MRIIAGKFKKAELTSIKGSRIRPTTDYVKETVFNIISNIKNSQVLDLFAGSGSLGLEALSRGATFVTFVDFSEKAISAMIKNFDKLNCRQDCRIYRKRVASFLNKFEKKFDLIFLDPPYNRNLVNPTIRNILNNNILIENGQMIVEHSPQEKINEEKRLRIETRKLSQNTSVSLITIKDH